jgi:broad specificity phosphatase PhoE
MVFYFVRHPETEANVKKLIYGRTDSAYSERGKASVDLVVDRLSQLKIDKIFSSPLRRAAFLADAIAKSHQNEGKKIEVIEDSRLQEMDFGLFENKTDEEARAIYGEGFHRFWVDFPSFQVPEGENLGQVRDRTVEFIKEISAPALSGKSFEEMMMEDPAKVINQQKDIGQIIVIVAHSLVIKSALSFLLNMPLDNIWHIDVEPAGIVEVSYHNGFGILTGLNNPHKERRNG